MSFGASMKNRGSRIRVSFPYSPQAVASFKQTVPGAKWEPNDKEWSTSKDTADRVLQFCQQYDLPCDELVQEFAEKAEDLYDVEWYHAGPRVRYHKLDPLFDGYVSGAWTQVPTKRLMPLMEWAKSAHLKISPEVEAAAKSQLNEISYLVKSRANKGEPVPITGLVTTPLPEQWVPANLAQSINKFLLSDEQGFGKTLESLMVARLKKKESKRLVILCPDRLTENWMQEIATHFEEGTFHPYVIKGRANTPIPKGIDTVILGWSLIAFWSDTLQTWNPDMAIADEGHYGKAGKAQMGEKEIATYDEETEQISVETKIVKKSGSFRSTGFLDLMQNIGDTGKAIILTGTPIISRPLELIPILEALEIEGIFGGIMGYKERYCGPEDVWIGAGKGRDGYVRQYKGASNTQELNARLGASGRYIRRTKQHLVITERLPHKFVDGVDFYNYNVSPEPVLIEGDDDITREYFIKEHELKYEFQSLAKYRGDRLTVASRKAIEKAGAKELRRLTELRQLAGLAAVPDVVAKTRGFLANQEKLVIAAHHSDVIQALSEQIPAETVRIQGQMSMSQIEEAKQRFNSGGFDYPVMLLSIEAGKTGHTLCKQPDKTCANLIFAEPCWNYGDAVQAQDRIWRIGQNRTVNISNIIVDHTVAVDIFNAQKQKRLVMNSVIDGIEATNTNDDKSVAKFLALNLAQKDRLF